MPTQSQHNGMNKYPIIFLLQNVTAIIRYAVNVLQVNLKLFTLNNTSGEN